VLPLSPTGVLRLVDSVAIVMSQAYQLARVRLASAASPILRLLVQRDHGGWPGSGSVFRHGRHRSAPFADLCRGGDVRGDSWQSTRPYSPRVISPIGPSVAGLGCSPAGDRCGVSHSLRLVSDDMEGIVTCGARQAQLGWHPSQGCRTRHRSANADRWHPWKGRPDPGHPP
jgi:hypothetical protein